MLTVKAVLYYSKAKAQIPQKHTIRFYFIYRNNCPKLYICD